MGDPKVAKDQSNVPASARAEHGHACAHLEVARKRMSQHPDSGPGRRENPEVSTDLDYLAANYDRSAVEDKARALTATPARILRCPQADEAPGGPADRRLPGTKPFAG